LEVLTGFPPKTAETVSPLWPEYVGTAQRPRPFGGRDACLDRLTTWLTSGPGHCLLVAPTGRGKTALLCHWLAALPADQAVVFVPVSMRFSTHTAADFFPALLGRLAHLHGEEPPRQESFQVAQGLVREYLSRALLDGRPLLVVLDGVDEASGWEAGSWLAPDLPGTTRIVLSMRASAELGGAELRRKLGLRSHEAQVETLEALSKAECRAVIAQHGRGLSPAQTEEMVELSEGDPLILRLLLDEPAYLGSRNLTPGLAGVWERQMVGAESLRNEVFELAALLACARGPLARADLLTLLEVEGPAFDAARQVIHRLVLETQVGWVFCHPRLGEWFREEQLQPATRSSWEERLRAWGRRAIEAMSADGELIPKYVLSHWSSHLPRKGVEDWMLLTTAQWFQARTRESAAGVLDYLRDLAKVQEVLLEIGGRPSDWVECLLCRASVNSRRANLDPELVGLALENGRMTVPEVLAEVRFALDARRLSQQRDRAELLFQKVLPFLTEADLPSALEVASEGDRVANLDDPRYLRHLVPRLLPDHDDRVAEAVGSVKNEGKRFMALVMLLKQQAGGLERWREAWQTEVLHLCAVAHRPYPFLGYYRRIRDALGAASVERWRDEALATAAAIERADSRVYTLLSLVTALPANEQGAWLARCVPWALEDSGHPLVEVIEAAPSLEVEAALIRQAFQAGGVQALLQWLWRPSSREVGDGWRASSGLLDSPPRWEKLEDALTPHQMRDLAHAAWAYAEDHFQRSFYPGELKFLAERLGRRLLHARLMTNPAYLPYGRRHFIELLGAECRLEILAEVVAERARHWAHLIPWIVKHCPRHLLGRVEEILEQARPQAQVEGLYHLAERARGKERARLVARLEAAKLEAPSRPVAIVPQWAVPLEPAWVERVRGTSVEQRKAMINQALVEARAIKDKAFHLRVAWEISRTTDHLQAALAAAESAGQLEEGAAILRALPTEDRNRPSTLRTHVVERQTSDRLTGRGSSVWIMMSEWSTLEIAHAAELARAELASVSREALEELGEPGGWSSTLLGQLGLAAPSRLLKKAPAPLEGIDIRARP
jgi:hypothetical protein